jgi:hypothetical protein
MDVWSWSSPIALGLFLLMVGGTVVLLATALAVMSQGVKVLTNLPVVKHATRRRRR